MSAHINDGGAAFPFAATDPSNVPMQAQGMSLRDWFAGQAPVTMEAAALACGWADVRDSSVCIDSNRTTIWAVMSMMRYEYADAMLSARRASE